MKKNIVLFSVVLFSFFACKSTKHTCEQTDGVQSLPAHTSTPAEPSELTTITGKIIDPNKEPMPFVNVVAKSENGQQFGVLTDMDGHFILKNIPNNTYTLTISYIGYTTQIYGPLKITHTQIINFEMIEAGKIDVIVLKPVIYLYPKEKTAVHVALDYAGQLIHTYPRYGENGWDMTAHPDGTLLDSNGRTYYALYWEGDQEQSEIPNCGQVVSNEESIPFLEKNLALLGLSEREANEFIMYWLPQMENNPFNLIHFSTAAYNAEVPLNVTPRPDHVIRIMMTLVPLKKKIDYPIQEISKNTTERSGFTVVEWGGMVMHIDETAE